LALRRRQTNKIVHGRPALVTRSNPVFHTFESSRSRGEIKPVNSLRLRRLLASEESRNYSSGLIYQKSFFAAASAVAGGGGGKAGASAG
jgi:hypothetical protein